MQISPADCGGLSPLGLQPETREKKLGKKKTSNDGLKSVFLLDIMRVYRGRLVFIGFLEARKTNEERC